MAGKNHKTSGSGCKIKSSVIKELEALPDCEEAKSHYTEEEVEILKRYYKTKNKRALAEYLGRSYESILKKGQALGLTTKE